MSGSSSSQQYECRQVTALKTANRKPLARVVEAQGILDKVHRLVRPLMRKYKWSVGKLVEFFPRDSHLLGLNVNQGEKICLRLRPPQDATAFLPYNEIVGTMLHELTHNNIGPHNKEFYKFYDSLWDQCEKLLDGGTLPGVPAEGFEGSGNRLSTGKRPPQSARDRRAAIAAAALKRARFGKIMGGGGKRLGGMASNTLCSPRTLKERALRAAERRRCDALSCGVKVEESPSQASSQSAFASGPGRRSGPTTGRAKENTSTGGEGNTSKRKRPHHQEPPGPSQPKKPRPLSDEQFARNLHKQINFGVPVSGNGASGSFSRSGAEVIIDLT
jgi:DNA-dependent metalloprotease WSS1